MQRSERLHRRTFLKVCGTATGGLLLGFCWPDGRSTSAYTPPSEAHDLNAFIRVEQDGAVTLTVPRPEMGQGVRTALAMILADELEADWSTVRIEQADLDEKYGSQFAGGSLSVRRSWEPLRAAGATARALLVTAAAQTWQVDAAECYAREGEVVHRPTERRLPYGALVETATTLPVPEESPLKPAADFRLIGQRMQNVDAPAIVRGTIPFGLDVKVPGMVYAVVERCPVFGGTVMRYEASAALAVPGVHQVIAVDADAVGGRNILPNSPNMANGVAVVAASTWAALKGREALSVTWDEGPAQTESSAALRERFVDRSRQAGEVLRDDGDVDAALADAAQRLDAVYEVPFLAHVPMEPMNAVADVRDGRCTVWAPTQNPAGVRDALHAALGLPPEAIQVHVTRMGGAFGRRFYSDYVLEAATISSAVGAPVQVVWTREDDVQHGFYRPAGYHRLEAGLDAGGHLTAWTHHLVSTSRNESLGRDGSAAGTELYPFDFPAGFVPNLRLEYVAAPSAVPRGQWRAIAHSANVFTVQCFLDEVARAAGTDLFQFTKDLLGAPREVPFYSRTYDTGRLLNVLERAATEAGWGTPLPDGRGRGIAASYNQGSFVAEVAEVSVRPDGTLQVHRVVAAIDCGQVINPSGVEQQVEGAIIDGLSAMLYGEITVENGRVQQSNFHDYQLVHINACPAIDVHIIPSTAPPAGTGEPPLPPLAPAVANAIFDATGKRIRRLPVREEDLRSS